MEAQVSYTAHVRFGESAQVNLHTYMYGGNWQWFGYTMNVTGHDSLGCKIFENVEHVDCGTMYFDNSEDAIVHAVAQFDGTDELPPFGLGSAENLIGVEDNYTGETVPTGWDAADHKALYEYSWVEA
jgi:hypothetical protein